MNPCKDLDVTITAKTRWGRPVLRLNRDVEYTLHGHLPPQEQSADWDKLPWYTNPYGDIAVVSVCVPYDYETDLASIPFFLWPVLSPWGPWRRAAVIHDYLCEVPEWPRFMADAIFRQVMYEDGVRWLARMAIYLAVRMYWECYGKWRK